MNDVTEFRPISGMDMQSIARQGYGMVQYGPGDSGLIVGFYKEAVLNTAKSRELGHPFHESRDFVRIQHPGETLNVVVRPIQEDDKRRWPREWAAYQAGVTQIPDGIPISLLFPDKPHIEKSMRGYNIHTVEQLATLSAQAIDTVGMGAQEWVNAAKRYMERADKGVNHHQFEKALADKDQDIRTLRRQLDEVTALVRSQQKPAPIPEQHDFQSEQINATHQSLEPYTPPAAQFVQDLSSEVQPRRGPGRPRKIQEH